MLDLPTAAGPSAIGNDIENSMTDHPCAISANPTICIVTIDIKPMNEPSRKPYAIEYNMRCQNAVDIDAKSVSVPLINIEN